MKSSLKLILGLAAGGVLAAELTPWVRFVDAASNLEAVLFRNLPVPGGSIAWRRGPRESREDLTKVIAQSPNRAELYSLRALEAERQLDFEAAEADWTKYTGLAANRLEAFAAKADYHHRRVEPVKEIESLQLALAQATPVDQQDLPAEQQVNWKLAKRALQVIADQAMGPDAGIAQYKAFVERYPRERSVYTTYADYLALNQRWTEYAALSDAFAKAFPEDQAGVFRLRARRSAESAIALYDKAFRADWGIVLVNDYLTLLKENNAQRAFLGAARARVRTEPGNIEPVARLFYYYQQQGNLALARRVLLEYRQRKESGRFSWTADELHNLASWFEAAGDVPEAAKLLYSEYALAETSERALVSLTRLLVESGDQPIRFGQGNLGLYRDIGTMDPHPGFWNGILSLLLNRQAIDMEVSQQEDRATAYFHHAKAAELIALLDTRFPNSPDRAHLHAMLIDAYGRHGASDAVIQRGQVFLNTFTDRPQRVNVALKMADAYTGKNQAAQEFAIYDLLLAELASKAGGKPFGVVGDGAALPPRSPEYVRILDRYVGRLVALKRMPDALALYRRELNRNSNDPALYERLAGFFEQNKFAAEAEGVYRRAIAQFPDTSWHHRLARLLLRQKLNQKAADLTGQVAKAFSGTDLERYFSKSFEGATLDAQLFLQVNLYANQRFPHHLQFVKNLMRAYDTKGTANAAAWEKLLRANWHYDPLLRDQFFGYLSRTGKLDGELAGLRAANPAAPVELVKANPAAAQWLAEAEAWRSHYEISAPVMAALADELPADRDIVTRAVAMNRSLSAFNPALVLRALGLQEKLLRSDPGNEVIATTLGEINADREWFYRAKPIWNRMPSTAPGDAGLYLNAATVFWDYYQYDDALRLINEGRARLRSPALYGYEAGAIYENKGDYSNAVAQYKMAALSADNNRTAERLVTLARRSELREAIESATLQPVSDAAKMTVAALKLRARLLSAQGRRDDLNRLAASTAAATLDRDVLEQVRQLASENGFEDVSVAVIERQIATSEDPLDRVRLRIEKARLEENLGRAAAAATIDQVYRDNPLLLGVVRAAADYHWRSKNYQRAVAILDESAAKAWPGLAKEFRLEAANKASRSNQSVAAGRIVDGLLAAEPLDAQVIAAKAELLSRQNDSAGLAEFYRVKITQAKGNPQLIASFRRGMIPALNRLNDFAGSAEQYIQLINQFPEDGGLISEAAQFGSARNQSARLRAFYAKAETDSPKDYRWPMINARLETFWENQAGALDAYGRALKIRPERMDLWTAKADLEKRLRRWDELSATYLKLYDLSYKNVSWLESAAEVKARQGRADESEQLLRRAYIDGRSAAADSYFTAARRLSEWNMPERALPLWESGLPLSAQSSDASRAVQEYAAAMTRLRRPEEALTKLRSFVRGDKDLVDGLLRQAVRATSEAVGTYYAPEEMARYSAWLGAQTGAASSDYLATCALTAGLQDLAVRIYFAQMQAQPGSDQARSSYNNLISVQRSRFRFDELGQQLETYSRLVKTEDVIQVTADAKSAYRDAGNEVAELRILAGIASRSAEDTDRLIALLNRRDPQRITAMINGPGNLDIAVANFALRTGDSTLVSRALSRPSRAPVWRDFYRALAGLYFSDGAPGVENSFRAVLGSETIGQRLAARPEESKNLTGDSWFYTASRLAEYRSDLKRAGLEDYLAAMVEQNPSIGQSHQELGDFYRDHNRPAEALDSYQRALGLNRRLVLSQIRSAGVLAGQGRKDDSLRAFQPAMSLLRANSADAAEVLPELLRTASATSFAAELKPGIESLLAAYLRRQGVYRMDPILRPLSKLYSTSRDFGAALAVASRSAQDPARTLFELSDQPTLNLEVREQLLRESVRMAEGRLLRTYGPEKEVVEQDALRYRISLIQRLLSAKKISDARQLLESWTDEQRRNRDDLLSLDLQVAAASGSLEKRLAELANNPPALSQLQAASNDLRNAGYTKDALAVLEFGIRRALESGQRDSSLFLDLAATLLDQSKAPEALVVLHRMTLIGEGGADMQLRAANMLLSRNRPEAGEFLQAQLDLTPWDVEAKVALAKLRKNAAALAGVMKERAVAYKYRVDAADWLGQNAKQPGGSNDELTQIAASSFPAPEQPYAVALRLAAAGSAPAAQKLRLTLGAMAIAPRDGRILLPLAGAIAATGDVRLANLIQKSVESYRMDANLIARLAALTEGHGAITLWQRAIREDPKPEWTQSLKMAQARFLAASRNEMRRPIVVAGTTQSYPVRALVKPESVIGVEDEP